MFVINYRDPRPIYEQVKDALRREIISGILKPDDKIPSIRDAAGQLAINPNTIQKAYRELESEGYIYSVAGKGSFVSECIEARANRKKELLEQLNKLVCELIRLGVPEAEICSYISETGYKEDRQ